MNEQFLILRRVLDVIMTGRMTSDEEAVNMMLNWIGYSFRVADLSPTLPHKTWDLLEEIDLEPLAKIKEDVIGRFIFEEYPGVLPDNYPYQYPSEIQAKLDRILPNAVETGIDRFIDPCGGSGGLMIELYNRKGNQAILYMAEPSVILYHVALINASMFDIPARILNANEHLYDVSETSPNWNHANQWTPPYYRFILRSSPVL